MNTIDLGSLKKFEVTVGGKVYEMREPSVSEVSKHRDSITTGDPAAFVDFLADLGMPKTVASKLGVTQVNLLAEGLLNGLSEKK